MMKNWINTIDENTTVFLENFGNLTAKELNWKLNSETWSIAENIKHLIVVNESYFPLLEKLRSDSVEYVHENNEQIKATGEIILKSVQPEREQKIKTLPLWEPGSADISTDILAEFSDHQVRLKIEIEKSIKLIGKGVVIASPANEAFRYTLETAFDVIVTHEKRHLEQAKELLKAFFLQL